MWPVTWCTYYTGGQNCQTLLGSTNPWVFRTELSAMQKSKDVWMKLSWPQLEVQIWRREGAVVKMSLRCQSDVQIYCGESLGQKIFMFFRSDRPLFCWSSSFKYLPALIVVRMNTNIFNQTISLLLKHQLVLKYQTIISGGPIPYFLFQLISAFISLAAQQVFHKKTCSGINTWGIWSTESWFHHHY